MATPINYNEVHYIVRDDNVSKFKNYYMEKNIAQKPIHFHIEGYEYWVTYDDEGRKIRWRDSDGNECRYEYNDMGKCTVLIISEETNDNNISEWLMVLDDFDDGRGVVETPHCKKCGRGVYKHDAGNYCPFCGKVMKNPMR